jgi:hypothetical protein
MKKMSKEEIYQRIRAELLAMADDEPLGMCYNAHKANIRDLEMEYAFQQKMHPTKNGRTKSDKLSKPAVFSG